MALSILNPQHLSVPLSLFLPIRWCVCVSFPPRHTLVCVSSSLFLSSSCSVSPSLPLYPSIPPALPRLPSDCPYPPHPPQPVPSPSLSYPYPHDLSLSSSPIPSALSFISLSLCQHWSLRINLCMSRDLTMWSFLQLQDQREKSLLTPEFSRKNPEEEFRLIQLGPQTFPLDQLLWLEMGHPTPGVGRKGKKGAESKWYIHFNFFFSILNFKICSPIICIS